MTYRDATHLIKVYFDAPEPVSGEADFPLSNEIMWESVMFKS